MRNIQQIWGKEIEPYGQYNRVAVYYAKNGRDQHAVYMDYGQHGKRSYKIIEDNAISGNRLNNKECEAIGEMLNNREIIINK